MHQGELQNKLITHNLKCIQGSGSFESKMYLIVFNYNVNPQSKWFPRYEKRKKFRYKRSFLFQRKTHFLPVNENNS